MTATRAPMIARLEGVRVAYGGVVALDVEHLELHSDAITAVIGPNGAGKSTLVNAITGVVPTSTGRIFFGSEKADPTPRGRARVVRRTFQTPRLLHGLTAVENVVLGLASDRAAGFLHDMLDTPRRRRERREHEARAHAALAAVGIAHRADTDAAQLSYGEVRLVEVARALVSGPRLLLLDEPAAGLNPVETRQLAECLVRVFSEGGPGMMLIEHDIDMVTAIASVVHVLEFGALLTSGSPAEVLRDPRVVEAYTGIGAS